MTRISGSTLLLLLISLVAQSKVTNAAPSAKKVAPVFMNKVWPAANPVETYRYYDFPFCAPPSIEQAQMSFGQILRGDRLTNSMYELTVGEKKDRAKLCDKQLTSGDVAVLTSAVRNQYLYEMYIADLPVVVIVGAVTGHQQFKLCTHVKFEISYVGSRVVSVNAACSDLTVLTPGSAMQISFLYSVDWKERKDLDPEDSWWFQQAQFSSVLSLVRSGHALKPTYDAHSREIHWISIFNSLILALMICSLVMIILVRIVRADLAKFLPADDSARVETGDDVDDDNAANWKLLHGDIFRPPPHRMWLCAAVGGGTQLIVVAGIIILLGALGVVYSHTGTLISTAVVLYMMSAAISGFVSARLYYRIGGVQVTLNMIVTALMFTGPAFIIWSILNSVAIAYNSTAALPFVTILQLFAMWGLVTIPLTVIGGTVGRQSAIRVVAATPFPVKTNRLAREIPRTGSILYSLPFQVTVCGFLAFWSVYLELKFVFKSMWSDGQVYTLYGILVVALVLLFLLATVLFTYFQLNAEDYRWWWRSFISGGAVAVFFYLYCGYFYMTSAMNGGLQSSFFFLYSALIAYGVALMIGASSFGTTYQFVWFIYRQIKSD